MPTIICSHCSEVVTVKGVFPDLCPACGRTLCIEDDSTRTAMPFRSTMLQVAESQRKMIGRYLVQSKLGAGAFGSVFLAQDPKLDRLVAIKIPRSDTGTSAIALERFAREGRTAAQLRHPGIVSVFNVEVDDELPFIVCEYVEGEPLSDRLRKARLPLREAVRLVADVATAVDYAHRHGIIHRDIKPSNIMIAPDGKPRLMDFGLAKREAIDLTVTADHAVLGTPAYMSPEQAWGRRGGAVDRRSDIYSLGTVLYHLLTREIPFHGEPRMVLRQVIQDDPKSPRSLNSEIPFDLETIVEKAMQKEPANRYQTAGDLAADLERWLRGEPIQARPVTRLERAWRWCRRNPITSVLVASIVLLLASMACGATVMYSTERKARMTLEEALLENSRLLSKAYVEHANRYMDPVGPVDQYSPLTGLPWLLAAHQVDKKNPTRREASLLRMALTLKMMPTVDQVWVHPGDVRIATSSPTGDWFFTGGADGTGRLWRLSGEATPPGPLSHPAAVTSAEFSFDNKLLLTGCADGAARLWDTVSGKLLAGPLFDPKFSPPKKRTIMDLRGIFSPDARLFATYRNKTIQIWQTATRRPLGPPLELSGFAGTFSFADDNALLVAAITDGSTQVWDTKTGKSRQHFQMSNRGIPAMATLIAVSPDGATLARADDAHTIVLWDLKSAKELSRLHASGRIDEFQFSADSQFLAAGTQEGEVVLWHANSSRQLWRQRVATGYVWMLKFSPRAGELAVGTGSFNTETGGRVTVLDVATGNPIAEPLTTPGMMRWVDWIGSANALATTSWHGNVQVWRPENDDEAVSLLHAANISCTAFTNDRKLFAALDTDGVCSLTRLEDTQPGATNAARFPTDITPPAAAALDPPGKKLAVADNKSTVLILDVATGQVTQRLEQSAPVLQMAFTSDGRQLITVTTEGHLSTWDAATGARAAQQRIEAPQGVQAATIQGRLCCLLAWSQLFVRDVLDPAWPGLLLTHDKRVSAFGISADRKFILSGTQDGWARIWSATDGKVISTTPKSESPITSGCFSPDAARFATGAQDGTVRIWWTADGRPATGTFSHGARVANLAYTPDGRYLMTTSGDMPHFPGEATWGDEPLVRIWDASSADQISFRVLRRFSGRFPVSDRKSYMPWSIADMFVSPDSKTLRVATAGGVLVSLDLQAGSRSDEELANEIGVRSGQLPDSSGGLLLLEPQKVLSMWQTQKNTR